MCWIGLTFSFYCFCIFLHCFVKGFFCIIIICSLNMYVVFSGHVYMESFTTKKTKTRFWNLENINKGFSTVLCFCLTFHSLPFPSPLSPPPPPPPPVCVCVCVYRVDSYINMTSTLRSFLLVTVPLETGWLLGQYSHHSIAKHT